MGYVVSLDNASLDAIFGATAFTVNPIYVGLSTTTPASDGSNFTEPSGLSYARVPIGNTPGNFSTAALGVKTNAVVIAFPASGGSWGVITYFGFFAAVTGGTPLLTGVLGTPQTVTTGQILVFNIGAIQITMT